MKAVSTVIVIILILMISVALSALSYMFFSKIYTSVTTTASSAVSQAVTSTTALMKIESISINTAYIRNIGQADLSNFSVYVGDKLASNFTVTPSVVKKGEVGTIKIYDFIKEDDDIKITTAQGGLSSKKAPDPCDQAVLCLKFDEGSGTTAKDSSGFSGNDGTLYNGTQICGGNSTYNTTCPQWTTGKYGSALRFDGVNDYIYVGSPSSLQIAGDLTISFWAYPINFAVPNRQNPIDKAYDGEFALTIENDGNQSYYHGTGTYISCSFRNVWENNKWIHITLVRNVSAQTVRVYKNNKEVSDSCSSWISPSISIQPVIIGNGYSNVFNGTIDEVRIYNKAIY